MLATHRWFLLSGALCIAALISWARSGPGSTPSRASSPSRLEQPAVEVEKAARPLPTVSTLYEEGTSAYHARLFADEDGVVLVTSAGFTTMLAGEAPARHAVSLGPVAARQGDALVFWRAGSLRAISLTATDEHELLPLPAPPQHLLASNDRVAWIQTGRETGTSVQTLSGGDVRVVYRSDENVLAATLRGSVVYWVSQGRDGSWSIGRVGLDGQHSATPPQHSRPPSMLAPGEDGVYFYAGADRGVRRVTFDLQQETAALAQVICSPLVVSRHVVCAQVGGLFDIPPSSSAPRFLASERAGPITAVAATHDRAYWVAERGDQQLVVRTVAIAEP